MAEATIRTKYKILRVMLRNNVNLTNSEEVKLFIARNKSWSNGHKIIAVYAYNDYAKMLRIKWEIPYYKKSAKSLTYRTQRNGKKKKRLGVCRSFFFKANLDSSDSRCKKIVQ